MTLKLMTYAGLGKERKIRKLLDRAGSDFNVDAYDAEGLTALHHACSHGHTAAALLLLGRGSDVDAEDFAGNSPVHLAASGHHLSLLSTLLQVSPPPDIDRKNARGVTVRSLTDAAMHRADIDDWRSGNPVEPLSDAQPRSAERSPEGQDPDPETVWRQRLAAEEDSEANPWSGGGWGDPNWEDGDGADLPGVPWGGAGETEDQFASRIWAEMQRRKNRDVDAAEQAFKAQRDKANAARQAAESEAYQRSQRILEAELAKDRAWRDAVKQGDLGVRRAKYEARWHAFAATASVAGESSLVVPYCDVPWLVDKAGGDIEALVLYGTSGKDEQRKRLRVELMRWHPDKFHSRFGKRLLAKDTARILERVEAQTKALNALAARHK